MSAKVYKIMCIIPNDADGNDYCLVGEEGDLDHVAKAHLKTAL